MHLLRQRRFPGPRSLQEPGPANRRSRQTAQRAWQPVFLFGSGSALLFPHCPNAGSVLSDKRRKWPLGARDYRKAFWSRSRIGEEAESRIELAPDRKADLPNRSLPWQRDPAKPHGL